MGGSNALYHIEISLIINWLIDLWGGELLTTVNGNGPVDAAVIRLTGDVRGMTYNTDVLIISPEIDNLEHRKEVVDQFLRL